MTKTTVAGLAASILAIGSGVPMVFASTPLPTQFNNFTPNPVDMALEEDRAVPVSAPVLPPIDGDDGEYLDDQDAHHSGIDYPALMDDLLDKVIEHSQDENDDYWNNQFEKDMEAKWDNLSEEEQ